MLLNILDLAIMKKHLLFCLFLVLCYNSFAKPSFTQSKYLIGCLDNGTTGTVHPGTADYPLVFYPDRDSETATDSDYWLVKDLGSGKYTFQNFATSKYIQYSSSSADRTSLILVDSLQTDESTSFTMELKQTNNLSYYVIRSVSNTAKIWDRREPSFSGLYPVGTYSGTGSNNECFLFYNMSGDAVIDDGNVPVTMPTVGPSLGTLKSLLDTLSFDGKVPVVNTAKKEFYLTIPASQMGTNVTMKVFYSAKNSHDTLYINGTPVVSGSSYTFNNVSGTATDTIRIQDGTSVSASGTIVFSSFPFVQLYSDLTITATYTLGRIVVTEPDKTGSAEYLLSNLKTRGAYSSSLPKKAYAIKLKDVDGATSLDRSFFGLRSDNNWILDAMGIDPSRMRNRVSTDLWNAFSTPTYYAAQEPTMVNGTRGTYVEVFLNDSYNGLYCMTEKIDRKQLKLKKYKAATSTTAVIQRGGLYKADDWSIATLLGNGSFNNYSGIPTYSNTIDTWSGFEDKYPDLGDGEPIEWKPLYNAVNMSSYLTNDATFSSNIASYFDLPVFRDYYLFIELMLASDNQGKNTYLSVYDQTASPKMSLTPWDLDGTWGRRWDGSTYVTYADQSFDTYVINNEHGQNNLYLRLKSLNLGSFNDQLKSRYKELRGTYFSYDQLIGRFQSYFDKIKTSGASNREVTRWGSVNGVSLGSTFDISFLSTWIASRLSYLDNQYLGGPYTALTDVTASKIKLAPNPVHDWLTVSNIQQDDKVQILSVQGNLLQQILSKSDRVTVDMSAYAPGIYLVRVEGTTIKVVKK